MLLGHLTLEVYANTAAFDYGLFQRQSICFERIPRNDMLVRPTCSVGRRSRASHITKPRCHGASLNALRPSMEPGEPWKFERPFGDGSI